MRRDHHLLAGLDRGRNLLLPVGQDAVQGHLEALRLDELGRGNTLVHGVVARPHWRVLRAFRRRHVVRPAPNVHLKRGDGWVRKESAWFEAHTSHLFFAVLLHGRGLVQPLQAAVVPLIELPRVHHGDIHEVSLLQRVPQRADRALEVRRVRNVKCETLLFQQSTGGGRLSMAFLRQRAVIPSGESVLLVPSGFAVANQDQLKRLLSWSRHHRQTLPPKARPPEARFQRRHALYQYHHEHEHRQTRHGNTTNNDDERATRRSTSNTSKNPSGKSKEASKSKSRVKSQEKREQQKKQKN